MAYVCRPVVFWVFDVAIRNGLASSATLKLCIGLEYLKLFAEDRVLLVEFIAFLVRGNVWKWLASDFVFQDSTSVFAAY